MFSVHIEMVEDLDSFLSADKNILYEFRKSFISQSSKSPGQGSIIWQTLTHVCVNVKILQLIQTSW